MLHAFFSLSPWYLTSTSNVGILAWAWTPSRIQQHECAGYSMIRSYRKKYDKPGTTRVYTNICCLLFASRRRGGYHWEAHRRLVEGGSAGLYGSDTRVLRRGDQLMSALMSSPSISFSFWLVASSDKTRTFSSSTSQRLCIGCQRLCIGYNKCLRIECCMKRVSLVFIFCAWNIQLVFVTFYLRIFDIFYYKTESFVHSVINYFLNLYSRWRNGQRYICF